MTGEYRGLGATPDIFWLTDNFLDDAK